jgi:hypothetical protein
MNFFIDEIIEIEELDEEETIDIEVDGNHLFYANGILVHNSSIEAEKVNQGHIQGGFSKIQSADLMIAIIQTDQMRATGEYIFEFLKTRNSGAVGSNILMKWDPIALRVSDLIEVDETKGLTLKPKSDKFHNKEPLHIGGTIFDKHSSTNNNLLNLIKT